MMVSANLSIILKPMAIKCTFSSAAQKELMARAGARIVLEVSCTSEKQIKYAYSI